jgi:hypothetical protein
VWDEAELGLNGTVKLANRTIRERAFDAGFAFVDMSDAMIGHAVPGRRNGPDARAAQPGSRKVDYRLRTASERRGRVSGTSGSTDMS